MSGGSDLDLAVNFYGNSSGAVKATGDVATGLRDVAKAEAEAAAAGGQTTVATEALAAAHKAAGAAAGGHNSALHSFAQGMRGAAGASMALEGQMRHAGHAIVGLAQGFEQLKGGMGPWMLLTLVVGTAVDLLVKKLKDFKSETTLMKEHVQSQIDAMAQAAETSLKNMTDAAKAAEKALMDVGKTAAESAQLEAANNLGALVDLQNRLKSDLPSAIQTATQAFIRWQDAQRTGYAPAIAAAKAEMDRLRDVASLLSGRAQHIDAEVDAAQGAYNLATKRLQSERELEEHRRSAAEIDKAIALQNEQNVRNAHNELKERKDLLDVLREISRVQPGLLVSPTGMALGATGVMGGLSLGTNLADAYDAQKQKLTDQLDELIPKVKAGDEAAYNAAFKVAQQLIALANAAGTAKEKIAAQAALQGVVNDSVAAWNRDTAGTSAIANARADMIALVHDGIAKPVKEASAIVGTLSVNLPRAAGDLNALVQIQDDAYKQWFSDMQQISEAVGKVGTAAISGNLGSFLGGQAGSAIGSGVGAALGDPTGIAGGAIGGALGSAVGDLVDKLKPFADAGGTFMKVLGDVAQAFAPLALPLQIFGQFLDVLARQSLPIWIRGIEIFATALEGVLFVLEPVVTVLVALYDAYQLLVDVVATPLTSGINAVASGMVWMAQGMTGVINQLIQFAGWLGIATGQKVNTGDIYGFGCFVGGTPVDVPAGQMNIELVKIGDFVDAWDEFGMTEEACRVTAVHAYDVEETLTLIIDGVTIVTTPEHPFRCEGAWRRAGALVVGCYLVGKGGKPLLLTSMRKTGPARVYNITVDGAHTFYVGACHALVHNKDSKHDQLAAAKENAKALRENTRALQAQQNNLPPGVKVSGYAFNAAPTIIVVNSIAQTEAELRKRGFVRTGAIASVISGRRGDQKG